jgi:hypothetical protein
MRKVFMMLVAVAALAVGLSACKPQEEAPAEPDEAPAETPMDDNGGE